MTNKIIDRPNRNSIEYGFMPARNWDMGIDNHGYVFYLFEVEPNEVFPCGKKVINKYSQWIYEKFRVKAFFDWLSTKHVSFIDACLNNDRLRCGVTKRLSVDIFKLAVRYAFYELEYRDRGSAIQKIEEYLADKLPEYVKNMAANS